ncbi:MAG: exo-alpha-sialidase, partial [Melioribacteraceae bacterium]|nr:exo-alpha-sialidase [Melioribacteraceae bacterium]
DEKGVIYNKTSTDNGNSWSEPEQITSLDFDAERPRIVRDDAGKLWLLFEKLTETIYEEYQHTDIYYTASNDRGESWSNPTGFTKYVGKDWNHSISLINNKVGVSFGSNRTKLLDESGNLYPYSPVNYYLWYGLIEESIDSNAPPILIDHRLESFTYAQDEIRVNSYGLDDNIVSAIIINYSLDGAQFVELLLYDDGLHNDGEAGDNWFANDLKIEKLYNRIDYFFTLTDIDMNMTKTVTFSDEPNFNITGDSYYFEINKIGMPMDNTGTLAEAKVGSRLSQGRIDGIGVLYSGGFYLTGINNGELWGTAMMTVERNAFFQPGKVGSDPEDSLNVIYVLRSND